METKKTFPRLRPVQSRHNQLTSETGISDTRIRSDGVSRGLYGASGRTTLGDVDFPVYVRARVLPRKRRRTTRTSARVEDRSTTTTVCPTTARKLTFISYRTYRYYCCYRYERRRARSGRQHVALIRPTDEAINHSSFARESDAQTKYLPPSVHALIYI